MNHFDALIANKTPEERAAWLAAARARAPLGKSPMPIRPSPAPTAAPRFMASATAPNFDVLCECGLRYGMHRVNDFACPNQQWRPGNGQPQWLTRAWKRAQDGATA